MYVSYLTNLLGLTFISGILGIKAYSIEIMKQLYTFFIKLCSVHLKTQTFQMCITRVLNKADASKFSMTRVHRLCLHIH